jgi:hypothetical protein
MNNSISYYNKLNNFSGGDNTLNTNPNPTPSTFQSLGTMGYNGSVLYGKFQGILSAFIGLIGVILFFYGIKLYFTDESNWKKTSATVTQIVSTNNKTCDKDILTFTDNTKYQGGTTQQTVYNCMVNVKYKNKDILYQIQDSTNNYIIGSKLTLWVDSNNPDNEPILNKVLMSKMWWMFLFGGLILAVLSFGFTYFIMHNNDFSAIIGTGTFLNNMFTR